MMGSATQRLRESILDFPDWKFYRSRTSALARTSGDVRLQSPVASGVAELALCGVRRSLIAECWRSG